MGMCNTGTGSHLPHCGNTTEVMDVGTNHVKVQWLQRARTWDVERRAKQMSHLCGVISSDAEPTSFLEPVPGRLFSRLQRGLPDASSFSRLSVRASGRSPGADLGDKTCLK